MRATRIELAYPAWEAGVLPLNYARLSACLQGLYTPLGRIVKKNPPGTGQIRNSASESSQSQRRFGLIWPTKTVPSTAVICYDREPDTAAPSRGLCRVCRIARERNNYDNDYA